MKIVELIDGAWEIRWTWLPLWLATNPKLRSSLEGELQTLVALSGLTDSESDAELLHAHVVRRLQELFPAFKGLDVFLNGMKSIEPS